MKMKFWNLMDNVTINENITKELSCACNSIIY